MPKAVSPAARQARRHNPLDEDLLARGLLKQKAPKRGGAHGGSDDEDGPGFVDSKASKRILQLGRELATEGDEEAATRAQKADAFTFGSRFPGDEEDAEIDEQPDSGGAFGDDDVWEDEDKTALDDGGEGDLEPEDLAAFDKIVGGHRDDDPLLSSGLDLHISDKKKTQEDGDAAEETTAAGSRNLADIILAKIAEHEAGQRGDGSNMEFVPAGHGAFGEDDGEIDINPKVVEVYSKCGLLLSRWTSGKLPKPLKILPTVPQWETLLEIAQPEGWSPNACYEMTKIFVSAKAEVGRRFMEMVILDRVRDDIRETKKLNVHLFAALKKSLFRPAAFFKGFLFPLVLSGTTTLREAQIISAALVRTSIPVLHSSAALKGLCDIAAEISPDSEGQSAISVFIKALLDKRYALPYQVVDALVIHFLRARASAVPPVVWHQSFLLFAQRYHDSITEDQREALLDLLLTHGHAAIGPEIRRELLAGRGRGIPMPAQSADFDGDDTMLIDA
ncbi:essential nuclear protein 1 [Sporothrix schenckii 1099-18]|uniref:Essential nuclear protein 1 n=1 Tax=Sporothrix schenckii 1099-18 TaxID=1397361 RepID=A0A0F2LZJ2_SPOSC|nr:essential nuclear protein 1 [Sporothrix schenckii 1099-18]KJR82249.1 essential nuclear protein 1 [Sporothrix schenckii 1099-18]